MPKIFTKKHLFTSLIILIILLIGLTGLSLYQYQRTLQLQTQIKKLTSSNLTTKNKLESIGQELNSLKGQDQYVINQSLKQEIHDIEKTYQKSVTVYEHLADLKILNPKTDKNYDVLFAQAIAQLADKNFSSADGTLNQLDSQIRTDEERLISISAANTVSAPASNSAPNSGFSRQSVHTDRGDFIVDIIAADLGSTRVIVDTASDGNCSDNCPVIPLADYVSRSGAYAGVNGSYFCPAEYPSCAGKKNSFDLLAMNKNKHYLNSDNNVYSTNPAVIFGSGWVRFVSRALEWGRDTSVDGVLSNFPLLTWGGSIVFNGNDDAKMTNRGTRGFVAGSGSKVFIGIVHNCTVSESAAVMKALNFENSINLDSGGSAALWYNGYKVGPGRNLPNAILFVRK